MPLLMGHFDQRHTQHIRQKLPMGVAYQKAGHITPLYRSGTGADANGGDIGRLYMGKQPAG